MSPYRCWRMPIWCGRGRSIPVRTKKTAEQHREELIPLTVLEVRVLLWQLVWHELPPAELVLGWGR